MKRLRLEVAVVVTAACLVCGGVARAQPISGSAASIEWMAARYPFIVRAVIEDVAEHERRDSINCYQTVSVRVLETVKGTHSDRLQFVHNFDFGPTRLSDLQRDKQDVLFFLNPWTRSPRFSRSSGGYAYARFPYVVERMAILTPDDVRFAETSVPPLTANLKKLSTPEQLIDAIQTYLKNRRDDGHVRDVRIELPPHLRSGYHRVDFVYPADAVTDRPRAVEASTLLDFTAFKERFAKPPPVEAKPPYLRRRGGHIGVHALEWMATDCDVIVRGVIDDWCFVAATDDPTGPSCGVQLRVAESLKGEAAETLNLYVTDARELEKLQRDQQEVVFFLRNRLLSGPAAALGYQTRAGLWDDSAIVLNDRRAEVLFADLTWHHEPSEILDRLRGVAERERLEQRRQEAGGEDADLPPPLFDIHPPASIAAGSSIAGNPHAVIYLPVDGELEANAHKWAQADDKGLRWLAARALIYFKSDENAALLQTLLHDDATWARRDMLRLIQPLDPNHRPEFLVRWEAWHVLDGWGYQFPQPEFRAMPGR